MSNSGSNPSVAPTGKSSRELFLWSLFGAFFIVLIVSYWNMFCIAANEWNTNEVYSHGYLIPILAVVILYMRRQPLTPSTRKEQMVGMGLILVASLGRVFLSSYETFDMYTFVIAFLGLILLIGGTPMLRWAGPIAFLLLFMFPLPHTATTKLLVPMQHLQHIQVRGAEDFRFCGVSDGNSISLGANRIKSSNSAAVEMTTIFLSLSVCSF